MPDFIDITISEVPVYIDIAPQERVYIDIVQGDGGGGAVNSVNGQTGVVVLDTTDVGADPAGSAAAALASANSYTDSRGFAKLVAYSNTDSTLTGTTTQMAVKSLRIPPGSMGVNGVMEIRIQFKKPVTTGTVQPSVHISDVDMVFAGKPEFFTPTAMNTSTRSSSWRGYTVNKNDVSTNNLQQITTLFPEIASTNALLAANVNYATERFVVVSLKLNNSADSATVDNIQVFVTNP